MLHTIWPARAPCLGPACLYGRECRRVRVRVSEWERERERRPQRRLACLAESRTKDFKGTRKQERATAATATQTTPEGGPEATPTHTVRHAPTAKRTLLEQRLCGSQETSSRRTKNRQRSVGFYRLEAPLYYTRGKRYRGAALLLYTEIEKDYTRSRYTTNYTIISLNIPRYTTIPEIRAREYIYILGLHNEKILEDTYQYQLPGMPRSLPQQRRKDVLLRAFVKMSAIWSDPATQTGLEMRFRHCSRPYRMIFS